MATGTTQAVRDLLARNPKISAAEAVAALPDHHPSTVMTQVSRQRNATVVSVPLDVTTLNVHKVWIDADVRVSDAAAKALPTTPYVYIVLRAGHDARFIEGEGKRPAREKIANIRSPGGVTDVADREWIAKNGGVMALIFTVA